MKVNVKKKEHRMEIKYVSVVHSDNTVEFYDIDDNKHTVLLTKGQSGKAILRFNGNTYYLLLRYIGNSGNTLCVPFIRDIYVVCNDEYGKYPLSSLQHGIDGDYFMEYKEPTKYTLTDDERIFIEDIIGHNVVFRDKNGKNRSLPLSTGKYGLTTFNFKGNVYYLLAKYIDKEMKLIPYMVKEDMLVNEDGDNLNLDVIAKKGFWLSV